jgi:hypothetical protein
MRAPLLALSLLVAALTAVAAGAGILDGEIYVKETASWAAQAFGQDVVTLGVAVPLLILSAVRAGAGSKRAFLIWLGVLVYLMYSYTLYALGVHFNKLFLVYIAILAISTYLFIIAVASADRDGIREAFSERAPARLAGGFLWFVAGMFTLLWLSEIVPALASGQGLKTAAEVALPVNPVHVMDLAFLLPAMYITGALVRRGHTLGYVFAGPLLVSTILLGLAILGMVAAMALRGVPVQGPTAGIMGVVLLAEAVILFLFLREIKSESDAAAGQPLPAA